MGTVFFVMFGVHKGGDVFLVMLCFDKEDGNSCCLAAEVWKLPQLAFHAA
jgi:hypothetical protein